jgi:hypothetical protein
MIRLMLRLAALLVPRSRRAEWRERWRGELWALDDDAKRGATPIRRLSFALGAWPDAVAECFDGWREGWSLGGLNADVRDAWRAGRRTPALSAITILILGVGTAATTTIFSLADATLLHAPPGITQPDEAHECGGRGGRAAGFHQHHQSAFLQNQHQHHHQLRASAGRFPSVRQQVRRESHSRPFA